MISLRGKSHFLRSTALISLYAFFPLISQPAIAADEIIDGGASETVGPGGSKNEVWNISDQLFVGVTSQGFLTITEGGKLTNTIGRIGDQAGSEGTVLVSGVGSTWENSRHLYVGGSGQGNLIIRDGGKVTNDSSAIGDRTGSQGTVFVSGKDSIWENLYELNVTNGVETKGTLTITGGGKVTSKYGYIGRGSRSEGAVTVSGKGSIWENSYVLHVGLGAKGALVITDGGKVTSEYGYVGAEIGSEGTILVSGTGATWEMSEFLSVGFGGKGVLTITDGGGVINKSGSIGFEPGSEGAIIVAGKGSTFEDIEGLYVGVSGKGNLSITDGGKVTSTLGRLGDKSSSEGTVLVSGTGATWEMSEFLSVGLGGKGALTISDGGRVINKSGSIGYEPGSEGTITVAGEGSIFENIEGLYVGDSGKGNLSITGGGKATSSLGHIGHKIGSEGTVLVSDKDSIWESSYELYVGDSGQGTLTLRNEGKVTNGLASIGRKLGSEGTVTVSGKNTIWDNAGILTVGNQGKGTLHIKDGGKVSNMLGYIGVSLSSEGAVTVSGEGADWDNSSILLIGGMGKGSLTINNRGNVSLNGPDKIVTIAALSGSTGTLIIGADESETAVSAGTLEADSVKFGDGTGRIIFNHTDAGYEFTSDISGNGSIDVYSGFTRLSGDNSSYTGGTSVYGGTLSVDAFSRLGTGGLLLDGGILNYSGLSDFTFTDFTFGAKGGGFGVANRDTTLTVSTDLSGSGQLTKTGAGTLKLTGANSYTGGTSVYGGTLSVDAFSRLGTGGLLLDGGILNYSGLSDFTFTDFTFGAKGGGFGVANRDTTLTVSTDLSGSGQLTKTGAGTLKLTGTNSYSGGTDVVAGRLVGSVGSIQGNLAISGGAAAEFYETGTASFAGTILGEGKLIKTGAGALTLSGTNMYSGGTDVEAGKLIGTAASIKGPLALSADATVVFDQAIKGTFSGNISGEGKLIKSNIGELILTGINTYSGGTVITGGLISISDLAQLGSGEIILDGGTFQTTGDTTLETDDFDLGNAGGHLDIQGAGFKISGDIATPDGLLKTGQGKLLLDGTDNKIGKTTIVKAGGLIIGSTSSNKDAKLETDIELEDTATLGGHGTLNGSVRNKGGVINPGNSVGTLTLTNYSGSGTLEIEVDSSDKANVKADKLIVSDTADFSKTELSLLFSPTNAQSWNIGPIEPLTIVELGGTDYDNSHVFKQVTGELSFLHTTLNYQGGDGNDIVLSLTRNDVGFADKALTPNQEATAQALEALGYGHTLYNAVITNAKTDQDAQQIFDQLSGEINASLRNVLVEDTLVVRQAVSARGIQHSFGTNLAGQPSASRNQYGFWAQGYGRWGTMDGNGETASITHQGGGMLMGVDVTTQSDLRLGAVFGYADLSLDATGRQSSASAMSYTAGAYASYLHDGWSVSAGLTNSWYDVDAERSLSIANGLLTDELTSQQSLRALQGFGEVGYSFDLEPAVLQPFAGAAYVKLASNGFEETGKEAALTAQSQSDDVFFSTLGLRGKTSFSVAGKNVNAHGMVAWQHASRDTVNFAQRFKGAADTFTITGAPIARDLALIETGFGMNVSESTNFALSYSGQLAPQSQNHGFNARMSVAF
jgi:outer membrane autotransporter protein